MSEFVAGDNPADHTVAEVLAYLTGDEVTGDEHDRVVAAERAGRNRVGIMSGSGVEEPAAPDEVAPVAPAETTEPEVTDLEADAEAQPVSTQPLSAAESIRQTMERLDARKGRNYDEVLSTRGARAHGES